MALTRPILASVGAFDATQAYTFTFTVIGGDKVEGNTLTITRQSTGAVVYNEHIDSVDYTHTLPANTLQNGLTYTAYVQTTNEAGQLSDASNVIQFNCYASATLAFTNMPPNNIVPAAEYEFEATYSQTQGDSVSNYIFNLYDVQGVLVSTSNVQYMTSAAAPPTTLAYKFSGFADNSSYLIECVVNSAAGLRVTTGRVSITVSYDVPVITGGITVVPNCQDGYMQGYIDWRQVPVGIDKLRVKRRRANEFNWITLKEFDNRARTMTMVEKPQAGIEKFYAISNGGAAVVKQTGVTNRSAASTENNGDTWSVGASFNNGAPGQIVGNYIANNFVYGYYDNDGTHTLETLHMLPTNLSIKSEGGDQANIPYGAIMAVNSANGVFYEDGMIYEYSHFPKLAHPVLYAYNDSGNRRRIMCHDYNTKKLYMAKAVDIKADVDSWQEVESKDVNGNAFTASQLSSFDGHVYAMDYSTKLMYLYSETGWKPLRALPSSIGTVRGFAATEYLGFDFEGTLCQMVVADEKGLSFVSVTTAASAVDLTTTAFIAGSRLSNKPNLSVETTMRRDSTGYYVRDYYIFDAASNKIIALESTRDANTWSSNVVAIANASDITPIMDKMKSKSRCGITLTNGGIKVVEWNNGAIADVVTHTGFYVREPYNRAISTSTTPILCAPVSVLNQYRPLLIFVDGTVSAIYPEEFTSDLYSTVGLTPLYVVGNSSGMVAYVAGPNEDNAIMGTSANFINIRNGGTDVVRSIPYSYDGAATFGTNAGDDMTNAVMTKKSGTTIQFTTYDITGYNAVDIPTVDNMQFSYNGSIQQPEFTGIDRSIMSVSGSASAVQSGRYITCLQLLDADNYRWADGSSAPICYLWDINRISLAFPTINTSSYTYTTAPIVPELNYDRNFIMASGDLQATDVGNYSITFTIADINNYEWEQSGWFKGGNSLPYTLNWRITVAIVQIPTISADTFLYDGTVFEPTIIGLDNNLVTVSGTTSTSEVGNYTITFSLKDKKNYKWSDNTDTDKTVNWSITPVMVTKPSLAETSFVYTTNAITPTILNLDSALVAVSGNTSATNVGNYSITCALRDKDNYRWADGPINDVVLTWSIAKASVQIPTVSPTTFVYSGGKQVPAIGNLDSDVVNITGNTEAIDADTYNITFSLKDAANYKWIDGTITNKTVVWTILPSATVTIPKAAPTSYTYTGEVITPKIVSSQGINIPYDSEYIELTGDLSATVVGDYTITASLKDSKNYRWTDNTNADKTIAWKITARDITVPSLSPWVYPYDGGTVTADIHGISTSNLQFVEFSGDLTGVSIGDYTIIAHLVDPVNTRWQSDKTTADKELQWSIATAKNVTLTRRSSITRSMASMEVGSKTYTTSQTVKIGTGGTVTFVARSQRPAANAATIRLNGTVVKTSSTQQSVSYSMIIDSNTTVQLITNTVPSYPSMYYGIINITTS